MALEQAGVLLGGEHALPALAVHLGGLGLPGLLLSVLLVLSLCLLGAAQEAAAASAFPGQPAWGSASTFSLLLSIAGAGH